MAQNNERGAGQTAWHGTAHIFLEFDLGYSGTGEGAADYGHGVYVTQSHEIARMYAGIDAGAMVPTLYTIDGVRTRRGQPDQKAADLVFELGLAKARKLAHSMVQEARDGLEWTIPKGIAYYEEVCTVVNSLSSKGQVKQSPGTVMQVRIPGEEVMLHWAAKVQDQPSAVKEALLGAHFAAQESGEGAYRALARSLGSPAQASQRLLALGIKGVSYCGRTGGENGPRNNVIFDSADVQVQWTVAQLRKRLADAETELCLLIKRLSDQQNARQHDRQKELSEMAARIRVQLHRLTGDWYGRPKAPLRAPSQDLLDARYDHPDDVPQEVLDWERSRSALYADASDAQRWARIVGTVQHERYDCGVIEIFRAVRAFDGQVAEIRPGDWVTTSRQYAQQHLEKSLEGSGRIISETVDGQDVLLSPTGDASEAIYAPRELSGERGAQSYRRQRQR